MTEHIAVLACQVELAVGRHRRRATVRLFSPGRPDECRGSVGAAGRLEWFRCSLAEDAAGLSLASAQSRALADAFLAGRGIAVDRLRYVGPIVLPAFQFLPWLFAGHGPFRRQAVMVLAGLSALTLLVFLPWRRGSRSAG